MELFLVRHTSVDVPAGCCYGQTDVPLKASFSEEALVVKEKLRTLFQDEGASVDAVFSSPLSRCVRLAAFCGYPDAVQDARILELNFGNWEMKAWDKIQDPYLKTWYGDWVNLPTPEGESLAVQYERVIDFFDSLAHGEDAPKRIVVFTHGGVIACARAHFEQVELKKTVALVPPYGAVVQVVI